MEENFFKYPDLKICSDCLQIYGFGGYLNPRNEFWRHWQKCDCSEKPGVPEDDGKKWLGKDFNKLVDLCSAGLGCPISGFMTFATPQLHCFSVLILGLK